jgi:hypothetical protein
MPIQIRLWWIEQITKKINKFNEVNTMSSRTSSKKTIQENSDQSLDISKVDKFFKKFEK